MQSFDNIHYSSRNIDGHNKPFNLIVSAREAGKSTWMIQKIWNAFKKHYPTIVLRRQIVDITELYVDSLQAIINKFIDFKAYLLYYKNV